MRHDQAVKVRLDPTVEQKKNLVQHFDCSCWWWNYALHLCIEAYKTTGKGLTVVALNKFLLKWLSEHYSQVLQATTQNPVTAYKNFFAGRAKYPRFNQYPQSVKVIDGVLKFPGHVGIVKAKIHRPIQEIIRTVTASMTLSGLQGDNPVASSDGKIAGINLGLRNFAIVALTTIKIGNQNAIGLGNQDCC
jgi:putative transposase